MNGTHKNVLSKGISEDTNVATQQFSKPKSHTFQQGYVKRIRG